MGPVSIQTTTFSEPQALSVGTQETPPPYLLASALSVAVAISSSAFAPPLALASWGMTAYAALPLIKESYQSLAKPQPTASLQSTPRRKFAFPLAASTPSSLANTVVLTACVATGNAVAAALGMTLYHFGKQLAEQSKLNYCQQQHKFLTERQQQDWWKYELNSFDAELLPLRSDAVSSISESEPTSFAGDVANESTGQGLNAALDKSIQIQQQVVEDHAEQATSSTLLPLLTASALSMPLVGLI